jgi:hypothetical protein
MNDGEHEGHSGHRIDEIYNDLDRSKASNPSLYLINAGTNDCQQKYLNMEGTVDRLTDLLNKAWEASPKAAIVLSTLLPSDNEQQNPGANERVNRLNTQIRQCRSTIWCDDTINCSDREPRSALTIYHSGTDIEEGW